MSLAQEASGHLLEFTMQLLGYRATAIFPEELSAEQQTSTIAGLCERFGLDGKSVRWFDDVAAAHALPFHRRPAVSRLDRVIRSGDLVLVANTDQLLPRFCRSIFLLRQWAQNGVAIALAQVGMHREPLLIAPGRDDMALGLTLLQALYMATRSTGELVRTGQARRKAAGLRYCTAAPYGWRWKAGRMVPDEFDRQQIQRALEMRQAGLSYYAIAARFLWEGLRTSSGREWSPDRVKRVCRYTVDTKRIQQPALSS